MSDAQIATYLNDHLAGSVAAIEILHFLESIHDGSPEEHFYTDIRRSVEQDQQELESIMERLGISVSRTRKVGAWLASKITEIKLGVDDPGDGALRVLESLEVLVLGIAGKGALWRALEGAQDHFPELDTIDFDRLVARAEEQGSRVEHARLQAAMQVFVPDA